MGFYSTPSHALLAYGIHTAITSYSHPLSILSCIAHIPTFCGTLFLTTHSQLLRVSISALCIGAFLLHPVGYLCSYYILYWIPPFIIGLLVSNKPSSTSLSPSSLFLQAIGSTMTTHAVGSVIWLYTHTTTPAFWDALFCRVWAERSLFAAALIAGYYGVLMLKTVQIAFYRQEDQCPTG